MEEDTKVALANMREHFELVIDSHLKHWQTIEKTQREAIRVAVEANDKRFSVLNGFREAMADQSANMMTRTEAETNRNAVLDKIEANRGAMENRLEAEMRPIQARLEEIGRPNWALMTSVASTAFLVVAAVWMIIGLKIDATVSPLTQDMTHARATLAADGDRIATLTTLANASTQSDAGSRADREQLNVRMRSAESANASRRTEQSVLNARMAEIETQFCSRDIIANLMHANDLRMFSMLWRRVYPGSVYPTDNSYYPKVCNQVVAGDQQTRVDP